jgi:hypothetical protein
VSEEDVAATAGLRRMVAHARDLLRATQMQLPTGSWGYGKEWSPWQIQRYAAHALAEQTLTLVLDCLPQSSLVSADEVADLRAKHEAQVTALRATIEAREAALKATQEARDEAIELQQQSESVEADTFERWERAVELAQKDAAAAVKFLLKSDGIEQEDAQHDARTTHATHAD